MFRSMILANLGLSSGFNMAAPASRPAVRASSVQMGSIIDAAKETQGPEIFWGSAGVENGHLESEIRGYDGFGKFLAAVDAAGLTDTLKSGEYTVFAPTDEIITDFETNAGGKMTADVVKYACPPPLDFYFSGGPAEQGGAGLIILRSDTFL